MRVVLTAVDGPSAGRRFELREGCWRMAPGGLPEPDGGGLPSNHPLLLVSPDTAQVESPVEGDGAYLNGHRINTAPLLQGDVLQVGTSRYRVELQDLPGPRCPGCQNRLPSADTGRCPHCGRELGAATVAVPPLSAVHCTGCGQALPATARFCPACGRDAQVAPVSLATTRLPRWAAATLALLALTVALLLLLVGVLLGQRLGLANQALRGAGLEVQGLLDPPTPAAPVPPPSATSADVAAMATTPPAASASPTWLRDGRVLLRYGGRAGEVRRYSSQSQVDGTMSVLGQSLPLNVNAGSGYTQEILANNGRTLRVKLSLDPFTATQGGSPFGALPAAPAPVTLDLDPRGRVLATASAGGGEQVGLPGLPGGLAVDLQGICQQLTAAAFPEPAVGVGDTWTQAPVLPLPGGGRVTMRANCRLDGYETVAGRACARIVTQLEAPLAMRLTDPRDGAPVSNVGSLRGNITTHFDPAAGALVRSRGDLDMNLTMKLETGGGGAALKDLGVPGADGDLSLTAQGKVRQSVDLAP
ncbi:MAG: zinc ribbon domain-containing protein [Fimbriimonadaceae bacterium]|nr:zinc ribbon domain-containing protein [Fimbriimonadaceae bacterium]